MEALDSDLQVFLDCTDESPTWKRFKASPTPSMSAIDRRRLESLISQFSESCKQLRTLLDALMPSQELLLIETVLLKRQLYRKGFYRKCREVSRDFRLLLDSTFLENLMNNMKDMEAFKSQAPVGLALYLAQQCHQLGQCFGHLRNVLAKLGQELFVTARYRHFIGTFKIMIPAAGSLLISAIEIQQCCVTMCTSMHYFCETLKCESDERYLTPVQVPEYSEVGFLNWLSFDHEHLVLENLGGIEEDENDQLKATGETGEGEQESKTRNADFNSTLLQELTWKDETQKIEAPKEVDEEQVQKWLEKKKHEPKKSKKKRPAAIQEEEDPFFASNSFFADFNVAEKKPKQQKSSSSGNKSNASKKNAPPPPTHKNINKNKKPNRAGNGDPTKAPVSKASFMNMLLSNNKKK